MRVCSRSRYDGFRQGAQRCFASGIGLQILYHRDGKYVVIGANGDAIFRRWMTAIGREDSAMTVSRPQRRAGGAHVELDKYRRLVRRARSRSRPGGARRRAGTVGKIYTSPTSLRTCITGTRMIDRHDSRTASR